MDESNNHDINQDPEYILPNKLNSTHQELLEKNGIKFLQIQEIFTNILKYFQLGLMQKKR